MVGICGYADIHNVCLSSLVYHSPDKAEWYLGHPFAPSPEIIPDMAGVRMYAYCTHILTCRANQFMGYVAIQEFAHLELRSKSTCLYAVEYLLNPLKHCQDWQKRAKGMFSFRGDASRVAKVK